jgi:hypothetical protein
LERNREQWDYMNRWFHGNSSLRIGSSTLQQRSLLNSKENFLRYLLRGAGVPFPIENYGPCVGRIKGVLQSQMCLMVTQTGIIGMAPPTAQIGDWVYYIKGFSIPVILRENDMALNSPF